MSIDIKKRSRDFCVCGFIAICFGGGGVNEVGVGQVKRVKGRST